MKEIVATIRATVVVDVEDAVLDATDTDDFKEQVTTFRDHKDAARHIIYNLVVNGAKLSQLDGWADQPDGNAEIMLPPDWEINVLDIHDK